MNFRTLPVILALLVSGCATPPPPPPIAQTRAPESAGAAIQALEDGLYDEAGHRFARILATDPTHKDARLGMAEVHLAQGRPKEALALFDSLVDDPLLGPMAQQGRGMALLAQGHPAQAASALRLATESSSTLWRAWNGLALIADGEKNWADADAAYANALAADPHIAAIHNNLGYSLLLRGRPQEAEQHLRTALNLDRGMKLAAANLRLALAWQGRYPEALAGVRGDDLPPLLNDVGSIALSRGDLDMAESYLYRAQSTSTRHLQQAEDNLAAIRAARGRHGEDPLRPRVGEGN